MIVRCRQCGFEQEDRTGIPASKSIPREQGVTVCSGCGGIWAEYVDWTKEPWGEGVVLADGTRVLRVSDLPRNHPILETVVKHQGHDWRYFDRLRADPDLLVARA